MTELAFAAATKAASPPLLLPVRERLHCLFKSIIYTASSTERSPGRQTNLFSAERKL